MVMHELRLHNSGLPRILSKINIIPLARNYECLNIPIHIAD